MFVAAIGWLGEEPDGPEAVFWVDEAETFDDARRSLLARLKSFETDDCSHCREQAAVEVERLLQAEGPRWFGAVEGDDYWIEPGR